MRNNKGKILATMTVLCLPFLVGSKCAFLFNSGGSSDNDKDKNDETIIVVANGNLAEPAAAGIGYESGSLKGTTGSNGEFQYEEGKTVRFLIGEIRLGVPVAGKTTISPEDLAGVSSGSSPDSSPEIAIAAINIKRLLHSLDADPSDDVVTIPASASAKALRGNAAVSSAIEFLDFSDDTAFVNAASQLVSVLTADYAYTATLLDPEYVRSIETRSPQIER